MQNISQILYLKVILTHHYYNFRENGNISTFLGLASSPFLERRNGINTCRSSVLRQNYIRKCFRYAVLYLYAFYLILIASGNYSEDLIPTVGFNMRKVQKGNVSIKIWDIGGQPRFRGMWERYCRGVNVIVYMVDAANRDNLDAAASELHQLMEKPQLQVSFLLSK